MKIILGVTGGIAAYKAADLCSKLVQQGHEVQVIMTSSAQKMVTALTFATLSKNNVITDLFSSYENRPEHVALANSADICVVAPATANLIGKYANGIADDPLSTFLITFRKPVYLAPAMNPNMWQSPAVQRNVATLGDFGVKLIGPATGHVACGSDGAGRMSSVAEILEAINAHQ